MNIHIFPKEKFTVGYINFINKNFSRDEHLFFLHGSNDSYKESDLEFSDNVKDIAENKYLFLTKLNTGKKILMHSLIIPKKLLVFFAVQQRLLNKITWIVWGADLYYYRELKHNYKEKIFEYFRKKFIKNVDNMATLVREDYDLAVKWYKTKAKYFYAAYMKDEKTIKYLEKVKSLNNDSIKKDYISILVGNSATETNNHMEVFKVLEKYKGENIKIFCPLSYGDFKYAEQIIKYGKLVFGKKFIPLTNFMNPNEYIDLLNSIDIGIFNNNRQQALGNIFSLGYLGKKLYIRADTSMWTEINDSLKLRVFKIEHLKEENFQSFIYMNNHDRQINYKNLKPRYDAQNIKSIWQNIFDS